MDLPMARPHLGQDELQLGDALKSACSCMALFCHADNHSRALGGEFACRQPGKEVISLADACEIKRLTQMTAAAG
jgi:hypothetical protein